MTKQEFMAISLPFESKGFNENLFGREILSIKGLSFGDIIHQYGVSPIDNIKLILRPISDMTKEIEHKGYKFIPIDNIEGLFVEGTEDLINQSIEAIEYFIENNFFSRMEYLPFILINKLIEWHFDIAGLIDKGEAIDYSTLEGFSF